MPNYDDSPEEAQAAIDEKYETANHLEDGVAAAERNLEFAEDVLREANSMNDASEIAGAQAQLDECESDLLALRQDYEVAVQEVVDIQTYWGF